jgi:MOSC domain-containing protein YiiM
VGEAARLFVAAARHRPMLEQAEVHAVANRGFEGCAHGRAGSPRQVLLVEGETLREFGLSPGTVRENITTEGIRLAELEAGRRLRVGGEAVLEVTVPCEPCDHMEAIRLGLKGRLQGRRGILCRVIESGLIRRGDVLEVIELAATRSVQSQGGA